MRRAFSAPRTDDEVRDQAVAMCATDGLMASARLRAAVAKPTPRRGVPNWWHPSEVGLLLRLLLHEVGWGEWAALAARFGDGRPALALHAKATKLSRIVPDVQALRAQQAGAPRAPPRP
eukprot:TRINITY_DN1974_c0_g1_i1.p4 TRINITY_DN1974_c0_g1~~TRINITY_DN1974_c0_g1_i1.p4  ORF type:complete len:119 (+),score=21.50 TRINITY_DN1974_c0_g1_i1:1319-1675(+)